MASKNIKIKIQHEKGAAAAKPPRWYFTIRAKNGNKVANMGNYNSPHSALKTVNMLKKFMATAEIEIIKPKKK